MGDFADRLKEERKRVNLTQVELGELGGVGRNAEANYENGKRKPDSDYFEAIQGVIDIYYLVTGKRSTHTPKSVRQNIYTKPEDALMAALSVQNQFSLSFSADQIKSLIGFAWQYQADEHDLVEFVKYAYGVAGLSLPTE